MTFIWLLVWLFSDTPNLEMWNSWAVALAVCVIIDVLTGGKHL